MAGTGTLTLEFVGERYELAPCDVLTFGRAADLVIDEANPFMYPVVGRIRCDGVSWWIDNLSGSHELDLFSRPGVHAKLSPRRPGEAAPTAALTPPGFSLQFAAGGYQYELAGDLDGVHPTSGLPDLSGAKPDYPVVALTEDEQRLLHALAQPFGDDPGVGPDGLPANRAVANELGWTLVKYNRKLDYLCQRLARIGVRGVLGARGVEARNRRWTLVRYAIESAMIELVDHAAE